MTNTKFIGSVKSQLETDRLSAYRGYKVVALKGSADGKASIVSPHYSDRVLNFTDVATCGNKSVDDHDFANCSCGFYSYSVPEMTIEHWRKACGGYSNQVIVEVAVSGKVIVCDFGYRASQQRITKLIFPHCWNCKNPGEYVVPHSSGYFVSGCQACLESFNALDAGITFKKFEEANSIEGYEPLQVTSARFTPDKITQFFTGVNAAAYSIVKQIDELAADGDISSIETVMSHARTLLNRSLDTL